MDLLNTFSNHWNVVLSLNLNEAHIIHSILSKKPSQEENIEKLCEDIHDSLNIGMVAIHNSKQAVARNSKGLHTRKSFLVKDPVISTGAGDNFNAGFCAGMLMDLEIEGALMLGHATSNLYMRSGQSPYTEELLEFLSSNS
jgi:sugar/nucleoside kinase (ribokinase family)